MQKYFFTTVIIVLIMVAFAVLNASVVPINLGFEKVNLSLALLIFLVFAIGAIVSFLFTLPRLFSLKRQLKKVNKTLKTLENEKKIIQEHLKGVKDQPVLDGNDDETIA